ncbi:MAG: ABC transporter ATP-binding protein [Pseudomonadota bacterium]|nr:ABC transporter ATP-binding protein [Pseudomonadota bacterium]
MVISLNNVTFRYADQEHVNVLDIRSWSVEAGEQVFLKGPSGSGKSTLLNILAGLLPPSGGEVTVLGERLDQLSRARRDRFRANHIGYVFQQFNLIPYLSALDNINLARYFSADSQKKLPSVASEERLNALGIAQRLWHKPARELSVGQQQRVAIARAMVNEPKLLIADEPTSSLDQQNRDRFLQLLLEQASQHNMTVVFVSHDASLSQRFSRQEILSEFNRAGAGR